MDPTFGSTLQQQAEAIPQGLAPLGQKITLRNRNEACATFSHLCLTASPGRSKF